MGRNPERREQRRLPPEATRACQIRRRSTAGVTLTLGVVILTGCRGPGSTPSPAPDPPGEAHPAPKPIETRRLHQGRTEVDRTTLENPLAGEVEITTWSDQIYRGRLVEETAEGYVLDVPNPGRPEPVRRTVPRRSVMTLRVLKP